MTKNQKMNPNKSYLIHQEILINRNWQMIGDFNFVFYLVLEISILKFMLFYSACSQTLFGNTIEFETLFHRYYQNRVFEKSAFPSGSCWMRTRQKSLFEGVNFSMVLLQAGILTIENV